MIDPRTVHLYMDGLLIFPNPPELEMDGLHLSGYPLPDIFLDEEPIFGKDDRYRFQPIDHFINLITKYLC
jgi:hypothetical protein